MIVALYFTSHLVLKHQDDIDKKKSLQVNLGAQVNLFCHVFVFLVMESAKGPSEPPQQARWSSAGNSHLPAGLPGIDDPDTGTF